MTLSYSRCQKTECISLQVCVVMLLGLLGFFLEAGTPKPCHVTSPWTPWSTWTALRELLEIPKDIPRNTTNLTLTINHIPYINSTSFQGLENIKEIEMCCNFVPIKIGPKDHMCTENVTIKNNSFKDLRNLKALYLDGNQVSSIPKCLPLNLILLSLESEPESSFSFLKSLKVLHLSDFVFQQLTHEDIRPLIPLKNLEVIDLGTNFIKMTNLSILMELKSFQMINFI
ncbi:unnamed protein product [Coregonus sp. 'balchen']|nr:unnamed protein product [Coregonus sp. 'balchen']